MPTDRDLTVYSPDNLPLPDDPKLARQLQKLQADYVRRTLAVEAGYRTGVQAIQREVDLNVMATREFARGTEDIVDVVLQTGRAEMAQVPIDQYARRRIDAMAKHTEDTVERAAQQIAAKATAAYDTSPPRKRSLIEKMLGD